ATYIAAIENSDPTAFESPGFVSGYIRSYARYLSLDPEWVFKSFCEESGFEYKANFTANTPSSNKRGGSLKGTGSPFSGARDPLAQPSVAFLPPGEARFSGIEPRAIGSVAVLIALVGAIGYGGWSVLQEVQKVEFTPIEETPGVLAELDPVAPPETELTTSGPDDTALVAPTSEAFDRLYRPQALDVPVLTSRDSPIATIEPGSLGVLMPEPEPFDVDQFARLDLPELQGPERPATAVQVVAEAPPTLALLAVRPSWVRVSSSDGTVIFEKILDAGERFELPRTEEPHLLRAGNAGSLYFAVGQDTYGPAGQGASVIRNVALSIEAVREGYVVADAADDADLARFVAVAEAQGE
ncbi:MAG: RodZ domain-containing protein, partial [Pseudomonadota bacterium]